MAFPEAKALVAYPRIVDLDESLLPQICEIETFSYPNPWSLNLLISELKNDLSLRAGVLMGNQLVAQSFNHLVDEELHILNIAVHPEFRGLGLAKALLAEVILKGMLRSATIATLEVRVSNEIAKKLYSEFDFDLVGIRKKYYSDNAEDALVMSRKISDKDIEFFSSYSARLID